MDFLNSNQQYNNQLGAPDEMKIIEGAGVMPAIEDKKEETFMLDDAPAIDSLRSGIDLSKVISIPEAQENIPQNVEIKNEPININQVANDNANPFFNNDVLNDAHATNNSFVEPKIEEARLVTLVEESYKEAFEPQVAEELQVPEVSPMVEEVKTDLVEENKVDMEKVFQSEVNKEESFLQSTDNDRIFQIELHKITPNPYQPRREFNDDAIYELASSIREYGILEPLIVKRIEKEQQNGLNIEYQLIAGERRFRASKIVGLKTVPAIIRSFDSKCLELEVALVENVQREDLSPIMKARAYAQLVNEFGYTQEMVGRRIGKSRESIANVLRLLQLPFEAQRALDETKISESHARALLLLPNMEKQRALLGEIMSKQLSSREAEIIARQFLDKQGIKTTASGRKRKGDSFDPKDLELREKLEDMFGAKVAIKRKGEMGEISIFFYSDDELDGLVGKLTNNSEKMINKTVDKLNNF